MNINIKKIVFSLLLFFIWSVVNINAQVVIGNKDNVHNGAVLELCTDGTPGGGLLLPHVSLTDASLWAPVSDTESNAIEGMMIYNTSDFINDGLMGRGVYVWNKGKWELVSQTESRTPITNINLSSTPNVSSLNVGETLTLAVSVSPVTASNKNISWSVSPSEIVELSNVAATGVTVKAITPGNASIIAVAADGSYVMDIFSISVNSPFSCGTGDNPGSVTASSGKTYKTFSYATGATGTNECWMVENSREGYYEASVQYYANDPDRNNGAYYNWTETQAAGINNPCPVGWVLPTKTQFDALQTIVNGDPLGVGKWWTGVDGVNNKAFGGGRISDQNSQDAYFTWKNWNVAGSWWSSTPDVSDTGIYFYSTQSGASTNTVSSEPRNYNDLSYLSVRCVKQQ
jgi:uncharacterized protein (TIGR02145 family)